MKYLFFTVFASLLLVADGASSTTTPEPEKESWPRATTVPKPCVEDFLRPVRINPETLSQADEWHQIETSTRDWVRGGMTPCGLEDIIFFQFRRPQ